MHKPWKLEDYLARSSNEALAQVSYTIAEWPRRTRAGWREATISASIGMVLSVLVAMIGGFISLMFNLAYPSPAQASTPPASVFHPPPDNFYYALSELRSNREFNVDAGINDLYFVYETAGPALRWKIIAALVAYIHAAAPPMPADQNSFAYCLTSPPPSYPATISNAMWVIGNRNPRDIGRRIDLSNVNFAYATFGNLNLQNVNFDHDQMCRTIFYNTELGNVSFNKTCLRFAIIIDPSGLTSAQMQTTFSLFKAKLPATLSVNPYIKSMTREDPASF